MTRSGFPMHPMLLGFEQLEQMINSAARNDGYPPFNVEQIDPSTYRITLAVAGFDASMLEIVVESGQLLVTGRRAETQNEATYLHRGIAERQFQRRFTLASGIEVSGASLENGLLDIDLTHVQVEQQNRQIPIKKTR